MLKDHILYIISGTLLLVSSCGNNPDTQNRAPIKLGDSSTIVTEKDSQYLKDDVMDLVPTQRLNIDTTVPTPKKDKAAAIRDTAVAPAKEQTVAGYTINFGDAKIVMAGLQAKDARKQNAEREDGLTYSLRSGNIASSKLYIYGVKNATIKQRYQSRLMLKSGLGSVDLRDLGLYTSGWNTIPASQSGTTATINLNSLNSIGFSQVNNNKIKNATDRELRKRRTNSRTIQSWMKEIKRVRNANDEPCDIILDNVQWQISGTDAKGKTFHKTIRIDA
jgi:hypothetical protein